MALARFRFQSLIAVCFAVALGCGGSSLNHGGSGGEAGQGATGGTGADGGTGGTSGSSTGGASATGGGGSSQGGSSVGGASVGGASVGGGASGVGGGVGGTGGTTGGVGGTVAGMGGGAAGTGGTVAGSAGCGFCPFVACAPPINLQVTAPANIADLTGDVTNVTTGTKLGDLQCYPNGGAGPCTWYCSFYQAALGGGDYAIELNALGYQTQTIEFSVQTPTNCGCCGCGCGGGYSGAVELLSSAAAPPECCADRRSDAMNCRVCGNACASGEACNDGVCGPICLGAGSGCFDGGQPCCAGLTCCPADSSGQRQCFDACPL